MTDPPSALRRALAPLRRRLRLQRFARQVSWAIAAGATAAIAAQLSASGGDGALAWRSAGLIGAGAGVTVLGALVLFGRRRPVDLLTAARVAEVRAGWQERLSTAVEHEGRSGAVASALRADAADHVRQLDVGISAPWRWPVAPIAWIGAVILSFTLLSLWTTPSATGTHGDATAGDQPTHRGLPTPAGLTLLADELATEAERTGDHRLTELAATLHDIAARAPSSGLTPALAAELGTVLEDSASSYGPSAALEALRDQLAPAGAVQRDGALSDGPVEPDSAGDPGLPDASTATEASSSSDSGKEVDEAVFTRFEEWIDDEDLDAVFAGGGGIATGDLTPTEVNLGALDEGATMMEFDGPGPESAAAEIIGASREASAGESTLAGHGGEGLTGASASPDLTEATLEAFALQGVERDQGRRVEVEVPTAMTNSDYVAISTAPGAWHPLPEAPVPTDPPPLRHRLAAARYFFPSQETAATR
jgi:hypothetical protein